MPETIGQKFLETVTKFPKKTAVMYKSGDRWQELNWIVYREIVTTLAAGLQTIGVRKGDKIAIYSNTRLEWAALDLAILGLGALTVPIYQSSTPEDVEFILKDSEAKILFCENQNLFRRIESNLKKIKSIERVLCFDKDKKSPPGKEKVTFLDELQTKGETALKKSPTLYELAVREVHIKDPATIIYTSGTTGQPKGVLLTHTQVLSEVSDAFPLLGATSRDRSLSFLPYAHILGRIEVWGHALIGYTMAFAQGIDHLRTNLVEVKPTFFISVPRVFEKIYQGILQQAELNSVKSRVFHWSLAVGREVGRYKMEKLPVPIDLALKYQLAKKLVLNLISEKMGGQLRFAISGGAPLSRSIAEFFHAIGILVLEGYGLTETTAAITVNTPFDYRFGTVGKPVGDVKIKIAEDGEILVHSKKVMKEYYHNEEATKLTIIDGWFHTGDIGELSSDNYLRITDRKKDLIKTAGGKFVAPQKLEGLLKSNQYISNVHIHGERKKYIVALITLNWDLIHDFADNHGIQIKSRNELTEHPKIKGLLRQVIAEANAHLASYESIKQFAILPTDFTIEEGTLTPSLKVKRKIVDQKYKALLDSLYK